MDKAPLELVEPSDDFHLRRMILIDSYRKGSVVELRLDGHTSINGINAAGKTTLLRMIPLFYGESPNTLVQGGGVNKGFTQFYLPHTTSYIVFEYLRRSLPCMAVLHASSNGEKVCYRFIDQPYARERFVDDAGELITGADLRKHLSKRSEFCSDQIGVLADYRSVIQNTVTKKALRHLAARFAFVGSGGRLAHIEKIATGMFSRVTSFRDLQRIIASCIDDAGQSVRLESSKTAMEEWGKEYRAYQGVMAHAGRMEALNACHLRHQTAASQLWGVHRDFLLLRQQHQSTIQSCQLEIDAIDAAMDKLDEETREKRNELARKQSAKRGDANQIKGQMATLDARKRDYDKQDIESLARLVAQIPDLGLEVSEKEARESALLGEHETLVNRFDKLKNERTGRFNDFAREQNALKEPNRKQADAKRVSLSEESATAWTEIDGAYDRQEQGLLDEKAKLDGRMGELRILMRSPQPEERFVVALDEAKGKLKAAEDANSAAATEFANAQQAHAREGKAFDAIDKQIQGIRAQLAQGQAERERLLSLSDAAPGTLLHFLREFHPQWTADIGRVVPEDLLLRDDLEPALVNEESASLYGISIDLSVIQAPRVANEEQLKQLVIEATRLIERLQSSVADREAELAAQSKKVASARTEMDQAEAAHALAKSELVSCKTALDLAEREIDSSRRQAAAQARSDLAAQEHLANKNRDVLKALKDGRREKRSAHEAALRQALEAVGSALQASLAEIDSCIADAKREHDEAIRSLDHDLESTLKSAGVDTEILERLKSETADAKFRLATARNSIGKVAEWRYWVESEWQRRPELELAHRAATEEADKLAAEEIRVENEHRELQANNNARLSDFQKRKREAENLLRFVDKRCERLAAWPVDTAEVAGHAAASRSQDVLEADMDRLLAQIDKETREAESDVRVIKNAMFEHRETTPCSFYEKRRLELGTEKESGSPFLWVPYLREWFDDAHRDARSLLLSQCRTFSGGVHDFHDRLTKFSTKVTTFSNDLKDKMSSMAHFRKIKSITVRLSTSFDSIDGWAKIKTLADAYDNWAGTDSSELPSDEFAAAVSQVGAYLQGRHTVEVRLEDLIGVEIEIDEFGQPTKTVKDEHQLKDASSNGLSYVILCVVLVGLINKIRRNEPVTLVWALDELRDLDFGNIEALLEMLARNRINLVSACPDADPDILRLFKNRYGIMDGYRLASFQLQEDVAHV